MLRYLFGGKVTTTRELAKPIKLGEPSRLITRKRIDLSTGGFVEIVWDVVPDSAFVRIHLGTPTQENYLDESYKYVRHGSDKETVKLLRELRYALADLAQDLSR